MKRWLLTLDTYSNETHGRAIGSALATNTCVVCGRSATTFASAVAASAYPRTGRCDQCQRAHESAPGRVLPFVLPRRARVSTTVTSDARRPRRRASR